MSNYQVAPPDRPAALSAEALKAARRTQVNGISRRRLLRVSLGASVGLWLTEVTAGTVGFLWPNLSGGFGGKVTLGTISVAAANLDLAGGPLAPVPYRDRLRPRVGRDGLEVGVLL